MATVNGQRRTRVKVCGITDPVEAQAIAALGADALGFIFVKSSPRCIKPERARSIIAELPPFVAAVGVFLDEEAAAVNDLARFCGLTMIQLHGTESPGYCRLIERPVVKAFRVKEAALPDFAPYRGLARGFLLDTYRPGQAGGTGETFNWDLVQSLNLPGPLILAGGLTPDNIVAAIRRTTPFAVDVNSGVEVAPGRKDLAAVSRLISSVVGVNASGSTSDR